MNIRFSILPSLLILFSLAAFSHHGAPIGSHRGKFNNSYVLSRSISGPIVSNTAVCSGSAATLTASGYTSYFWYDSNGNLLATSATYVTPVLYTTTTYYVSADDNGTITPRTAVTVNVATP